MATGGVPGNGCKAAYSQNSPLVWTRVGEIVDLTFPVIAADDINIDVHSTTSKFHKIMPGLAGVGAPGFTVLGDMDPATSAAQAQMRAWSKDGTSVWWRFEVPTNRARTTFFGVEFKAAVKSDEPAVPINDKQTRRFNLSFDGDDIYDDAAVGASEIT